LSCSPTAVTERPNVIFSLQMLFFVVFLLKIRM
jgi:hypothetical protein